MWTRHAGVAKCDPDTRHGDTEGNSGPVSVLLISLRDLFVYCQFLDIFKRYLVPTTISSNTSFLIWSTPRVDSRGTLKGFQIIFLTTPSAHRPFGNLVFGNFMNFQCSFCKFRHKPLMNSSLVKVPS